MGAIRISNFGGEIPKLDRRSLPDFNARRVRGTQLEDGVLSPQRALSPLSTVGPTRSVFRMFDEDTDYWLSWPGDVDVCRMPMSDDDTFRIVMTGDTFEPSWTDLAAATKSLPYPAVRRALGVPAPQKAPEVVVIGGSASPETRVFIYTWSNPWGHESAPSPASAAVTAPTDGDWRVTLPVAAPASNGAILSVVCADGVVTVDTSTTPYVRPGDRVVVNRSLLPGANGTWRVTGVEGSRFWFAAPADLPDASVAAGGSWSREARFEVAEVNLYMSVTTDSGSDFYYIDSRPVDGSHHGALSVDIPYDPDRVLGEPCPTIGWDMPPGTLRGIGVLPSGALYGFVGSDVCFSEPNAPYAWPLAYRMTCAHDIVAVKAFGQSILVATEGAPELVSGVDPASMTKIVFPVAWPCVNKRALAPMPDGVAYVSPYGLVKCDGAGLNIISSPFYDYAAWHGIPYETMELAEFDGAIVARIGNDLAFMRNDKLTFFEAPGITALFTDTTNGMLYVVAERVLRQWGASSERFPIEWHSKEIVSPRPLSLGAAKVDAEFTMTPEEAADLEAEFAAAIAANQALIDEGKTMAGMGRAPMGQGAFGAAIPLGGSTLTTPAAPRYDQLFLSLLVHDKVRYTVRIHTPRVVRLPAQGKFDAFALRLEGNVRVRAVLVGETADGLREA